MAVRSYQVLGVELGAYVLDWGSVEEVKTILLAQSQMFTAEHTLKVANADNRFSPGVSTSIFYGRTLQLLPVTLAVDGVTLYQGFIRSVTLDHATRTASISSVWPTVRSALARPVQARRSGAVMLRSAD